MNEVALRKRNEELAAENAQWQRSGATWLEVDTKRTAELTALREQLANTRTGLDMVKGERNGLSVELGLKNDTLTTLRARNEDLEKRQVNTENLQATLARAVAWIKEYHGVFGECCDCGVRIEHGVEAKHFKGCDVPELLAELEGEPPAKLPTTPLSEEDMEELRRDERHKRYEDEDSAILDELEGGGEHEAIRAYDLEEEKNQRMADLCERDGGGDA